jgi:SAM-dependent methyltransferase
MMVAKIKAWLTHPLTRGLDLDDPSSVERCRKLIQSKPSLRAIYREWYSAISRALPAGTGAVLEVGSGPGFLAEFIPGLITSEILACRGIRLSLDATRLPFSTGALRAIVMTNVLHHLPQPRRFFAEAARCVQPGGAIVMIEPWVSTWSSFVYGRLHHEPFDREAQSWEFPASGPLSGANGALPWILFARDRVRFEEEFPEWGIESIRPGMPFRYLLSGGVSLRTLTPPASEGAWRRVERLMEPWMSHWAMFAQIKLVRRASPIRSVGIPLVGPNEEFEVAEL